MALLPSILCRFLNWVSSVLSWSWSKLWMSAFSPPSCLKGKLSVFQCVWGKPNFPVRVTSELHSKLEMECFQIMTTFYWNDFKMVFFKNAEVCKQGPQMSWVSLGPPLFDLIDLCSHITVITFGFKLSWLNEINVWKGCLDWKTSQAQPTKGRWWFLGLSSLSHPPFLCLSLSSPNPSRLQWRHSLPSLTRIIKKH